MYLERRLASIYHKNPTLFIGALSTYIFLFQAYPNKKLYYNTISVAIL